LTLSVSLFPANCPRTKTAGAFVLRQMISTAYSLPSRNTCASNSHSFQKCSKSPPRQSQFAFRPPSFSWSQTMFGLAGSLPAMGRMWRSPSFTSLLAKKPPSVGEASPAFHKAGYSTKSETLSSSRADIRNLLASPAAGSPDPPSNKVFQQRPFLVIRRQSENLRQHLCAVYQTLYQESTFHAPGNRTSSVLEESTPKNVPEFVLDRSAFPNKLRHFH